MVFHIDVSLIVIVMDRVSFHSKFWQHYDNDEDDWMVSPVYKKLREDGERNS